MEKIKKIITVQFSEDSGESVIASERSERSNLKIASSLLLLVMTRLLPRAELLQRIIIAVFFSLFFCPGFCLADNNARLVKEEKLPSEKKQLTLEIEKLKTENKNLENELAAQKNINSQLEEKAKDFYIKAKDRDEKSQQLKDLNYMLDKLNKERISFKNENKKLYNDIAALKEAEKKTKAGLYEELGTAYTQAKLYDNAIEAYEQSLSLEPRNAEVCYYLGLLYKHSAKNDRKAIQNLERYLKYKPDAKNKDEIKYLIEMLKDEF